MMPRNPVFPDASTLWVVHIGNDDRIALRAREEGWICIGWTAIGDLSRFNTRAKMRAAMEQAYPHWKPRTVSSSYGQPYRFAHEMKIGDPVVLPLRPTGEIAIGRIKGPYQVSIDHDLIINDYNNVRKVEWLKIVPRTDFSQAALHSFGSFLSVSTSDDYLEEVMSVLGGSGVATEPAVRAAEEPEREIEAEAGLNLYEAAQQETEDFLLKAWQRTGKDFEGVVAGLFDALGYWATVTPPSNDHGVDVIAHPDPLGLAQPYIKVQVKSGTTTIGEPEVNQLRGLLNPGEKGVFVSLSKFTAAAHAIERNSGNLTLIGAKQFVKLFLDHYEKLDAGWRAKFPLKKVYVPFT